MLTVSIVSPTSQKKYENVKSFVISTQDGEIEILPNHSHIISALSIGQLSIKQLNVDKPEVIAINEGIMKVAENEAQIMTNNLALADDIIDKEIEEALEKAKLKLASNLLPSELIQIEKEIKYEMLKRKIRDSLGN
ncbi:MAG: ATP synthase F1 subunit epsilon [Candidatus Shapirobacteria bacterium]|nr:ATP synthase F1 subunit epsilon [Candidatus Shapirobacteria bacterium]